MQFPAFCADFPTFAVKFCPAKTGHQMAAPEAKKKSSKSGRPLFPMSRTARKQAPRGTGATSASHGHSSTFVRVCQAPVFDSEAGSHGIRLLGAAWLPWRVLPSLEGAPAPTLDYLRPAPRYRLWSRAEGRLEYGTTPQSASRPPSPQRGEGAGGEGGEAYGTEQNRTGRGARMQWRSPDEHRSSAPGSRASGTLAARR